MVIRHNSIIPTKTYIHTYIHTTSAHSYRKLQAELYEKSVSIHLLIHTKFASVLGPKATTSVTSVKECKMARCTDWIRV